MNNAGAMRCRQCVRDLDRNVQLLGQRQCASSQSVGKSLAFQVLHDQEVGACGRIVPNIVQHADMRMLQRRDGARLALETLFQLRAGSQARRQNLDRDCAVESGIPRPIHFAHSARTQRKLDFVGAKFRARGQSHAWAQL